MTRVMAKLERISPFLASSMTVRGLMMALMASFSSWSCMRSVVEKPTAARTGVRVKVRRR